MRSSTRFTAVCARIEQHGLVAAECEALTGGIPGSDGLAPCDSIDRVARAAYVRSGVRVLADAADLDSLAEQVGALGESGLDADRFRIDVHDPLDRSDRSTVEIATAVADRIEFAPDLSNPRHRFLVMVGDDRWHLGEMETTSNDGYVAHDAKPWTTSSSLDARFARALVNLVPGARSILDPCCGAGSIVIEAASLGLTAYGVDWKPAMVGMTRENLAHLGYDATVERADSRTHEQPADAVVTDLPYGNAIQGDERVIRSILERCAAQAPLGVFVAPADISIWLSTAGYDHVEVHTVTKRRGFTRWIHVAGVANASVADQG